MNRKFIHTVAFSENFIIICIIMFFFFFFRRVAERVTISLQIYKLKAGDEFILTVTRQEYLAKPIRVQIKSQSMSSNLKVHFRQGHLAVDSTKGNFRPGR